MFGLGLGVSKVATKGVGGDVPAGAFNPASLFASNENGYFYNINDLSTVYEDTAGTTLQATAGGRVGKILDKSGNNKHAVAISDIARGYLYEYPESGVLSFLEYGNEVFTTATGWQNYTNGSVDTSQTVPDLNINPQKVASTGSTSILISAAGQHKFNYDTCLSFYVKLTHTGTDDCMGFVIQNAGQTGFLYVDVKNQAVAVSGGSQNSINATWTNKGNGWYLLELPLDASTIDDLGQNTLGIYLARYTGSNLPTQHSFTTNVNTGVWLSGIQLSAGNSRNSTYQKHHNNYKITETGKASRYLERQGKYETALVGDASSAEVTACLAMRLYVNQSTRRSLYRFSKNVSGNQLYALSTNRFIQSISHPNSSVGSESLIQSDDGAGHNYVTTQEMDLSTGSHVLRINGSQEGTSTITTGGVSNFGGNVFELRSGEDNASDMKLYALLVVHRELTASELDGLEQYMADQMVITI